MHDVVFVAGASTAPWCLGNCNQWIFPPPAGLSRDVRTQLPFAFRAFRHFQFELEMPGDRRKIWKLLVYFNICLYQADYITCKTYFKHCTTCPTKQLISKERTKLHSNTPAEQKMQQQELVKLESLMGSSIPDAHSLEKPWTYDGLDE